jgi:hypothetical protein
MCGSFNLFLLNENANITTFAISTSFSFSGGNGTISSPFEISNITQLQNINNNTDAHYILINDIEANETINWNLGQGFIPIGNHSSPFNGTIDGKGYSIFNLSVNRSSEDYIGLFGWIEENARVSNISAVNKLIIGSGYIGGFAGSNNGSIINCSSTGITNGTNSDGEYIGGFVGNNNGVIMDCYSTVTVCNIPFIISNKTTNTAF